MTRFVIPEGVQGAWPLPELRRTAYGGRRGPFGGARAPHEPLATKPPPASAPTSSVKVVGALNRNDFLLQLAPPILARDLVRVMGWKDAIGESTDVHRSSWQIVRKAGRSAAGGDRSAPMTVGSWILEASIDGVPSGPNGLNHAGSRHMLGANDRVRGLRIAPRIDLPRCPTDPAAAVLSVGHA